MNAQERSQQLFDSLPRPAELDELDQAFGEDWDGFAFLADVPETELTEGALFLRTHGLEAARSVDSETKQRHLKAEVHNLELPKAEQLVGLLNRPVSKRAAKVNFGGSNLNSMIYLATQLATGPLDDEASTWLANYHRRQRRPAGPEATAARDHLAAISHTLRRMSTARLRSVFEQLRGYSPAPFVPSSGDPDGDDWQPPSGYDRELLIATLVPQLAEADELAAWYGWCDQQVDLRRVIEDPTGGSKARGQVSPEVVRSLRRCLLPDGKPCRPWAELGKQYGLSANQCWNIAHRVTYQYVTD